MALSKNNYTADEYLEKMYDKIMPKFSYVPENMVEWGKWREDLKNGFIEKLGGFPRYKVDLDPEVLEEQEYDCYIRQRIVYCSDEYLKVPAYLLIPKQKTGRMPAVVACHGHGYGSREIVGLKPDGTDNLIFPGYQKNFALELVKRGFIVIVPDILGFGDRRLEEDMEKPMDSSSCHRISTYLFMLGKTIAGARVWDIIRSIDYLVERDDVDPERIGCMGISGGGLVCSFSSAVDERIKCVVVSGYTNTFEDSVMGMFHCVDNFIPGVLNIAEMPDIIGLIAPRPLLVESGTKDPIFPIEATLKAYDHIKDIYNMLGAQDKIDKDIFEGDHQISGRKAYDWLAKWLNA